MSEPFEVNPGRDVIYSIWLRAAEMCFNLPCVLMREDGRIDRIFPSQ